MLSLIFLKFVSDKFQLRRAALMADGKADYVDMVVFYTMDNVFFLPDNALHTLMAGLFDQDRLRQVIRHFIYFPDVSKHDVKIVPRCPQFYAAMKLYDHIKKHRKRRRSGEIAGSNAIVGDGHFVGDGPLVGDGKGGTYFGATGSGKSFTMLFLTRLLSERTNIICMSDEAHRSQLNLKQKVTVTETGVKRTYGFAKHLHDSLPPPTSVLLARPSTPPSTSSAPSSTPTP